MNTTSTDIAREILDIAFDGGRPSSWTTVSDNRWGGFDIRNGNAGSLIRVSCDDQTWTVTLMTSNEVERGSQTFTGFFARPGFIGAAISALL